MTQISQKDIKTETRFCHDSYLEVKEDNNGSLIVKGYISTTHFDGQDKVTKGALDLWAKEINSGIPRANKVSIHHNRKKHVAGVGLKETARVDQLPDGEYGLFVETLVDKTHEEYKDTKYRIDNNLLDSFSIEYKADSNATVSNGIRILDESTVLHGWTLASQPMNDHAVMIKEMFSNDSEEEQEVITEQKETKQEDIKVKETKLEDNNTMTEQKETKMSEAETKEFLAFKEHQAKQAKILELKEIMKDAGFAESIKDLLPKAEVLQNKEEDTDEDGKEKVENKELTLEQKESRQLNLEFKEIIQNKTLDINVKFKEIGLIAEKKGMVYLEGADSLGFKESKEIIPKQGNTDMGFKTFRANGSKLEFKSLGITTNQNTDTDYLLSSAELRDLFDPVIYDALNQSTTTFALLNKDDYSNKGNNQVQFVLRTGINNSRGFYSGNAVSTGNTKRLKVQTRFKKCSVGVSVDGDMIAAARGGPIGDVFGEEVAMSTEDLINLVNASLNDEVGLETAAEPIGFEYITDSAGNTTLYNLTRYGDKTAATYNGLAPDSATDTYINGSSALISNDNMRKAIEQAIKEGANINNLVFITHPTQARLFKGKYDSTQRTMPTSSRFGFEGRPEFDAVPIFEDKDINTDDWFLVDLESHRMAIWVPPTLEMFGKRSDAEEGFVKMYFATYNWNPRRMVQIYGNATS